MSAILIEIIGAAAAIIGAICWAPQAVRTIRTKDTKGLSLWTNIMLLSTVTLWFIYGLAIGSWPLVVGNGFSMMLVSIIVVLKVRYG